MDNENTKQIHHYWDQGLYRYQYFDGHSVEWLRTTTSQLALVNSLGATVSVALAAGMQATIFMLPGVIFFLGSILTLFGAFLAHRGNEKYAQEMKSRLQTLSDKNRAKSPDTLKYAKEDLRLDASKGDANHKLAAKLGYGALACIVVGALFLLPIVLCVVS